MCGVEGVTMGMAKGQPGDDVDFLDMADQDGDGSGLSWGWRWPTCASPQSKIKKKKKKKHKFKLGLPRNIYCFECSRFHSFEPPSPVNCRPSAH